VPWPLYPPYLYPMPFPSYNGIPPGYPFPMLDPQYMPAQRSPCASHKHEYTSEPLSSDPPEIVTADVDYPLLRNWAAEQIDAADSRHGCNGHYGGLIEKLHCAGFSCLDDLANTTASTLHNIGLAPGIAERLIRWMQEDKAIIDRKHKKRRYRY
jgi:hypothetical protein